MNLELTGYQKALYENNVQNRWARKIGDKTTVVVIQLFNGFEIVGSSGCVNPADYKFEIGEHFALVDALNQLDRYVGFLRQQEVYEIEHSKPKVVASGSINLFDLATPISPAHLPNPFEDVDPLVEKVLDDMEKHSGDTIINIMVEPQRDASEVARMIIEGLRKKGK